MTRRCRGTHAARTDPPETHSEPKSRPKGPTRKGSRRTCTCRSDRNREPTPFRQVILQLGGEADVLRSKPQTSLRFSQSPPLHIHFARHRASLCRRYFLCAPATESRDRAAIRRSSRRERANERRAYRRTTRRKRIQDPEFLRYAPSRPPGRNS